MKRFAPFSVLIFLFLFIPTPLFAADAPVTKTFCSNTFGYQNLDLLKADLLTNAKRDAVNELFGQLIAASTTVENFVVTNDQIRASSIGFVRVQGNVSFYNGENLAEVCVTIHAYATAEDRKQFQPVKLDKRNCITDPKLTTSALTAAAKQEAIIQALIDYEGKLASKDKAQLPSLLKRVKYLESAFVQDTETYCVRVTGEVIPIEVLAFLEIGQLPANPKAAANATATPAAPPQSGKATGSSPKVACGPKIEFNQTMECALESAEQKDSHTFTAEADDAILVTVVRTRGDLAPAFQLLNAAGDVVKDDSNLCQVQNYDNYAIRELVCRVPDAGTYSILIYDQQQTHTGKYSLRLQRLNSPIDAAELKFGQKADSSIDDVAGYKYYTFTAEADDAILVTVVRTKGDLAPAFQLLNAAGNLVKDDSNLCQVQNYDNYAIRELVCRVPDAGTYSILIYDQQQTHTGKYSLRLQRLNSPIDAAELKFGQKVDGSIDDVADYKYYTFAAEANDAILVTVARTRGDLAPAFHLRNAGGDVVKDDGNLCQVQNYDNYAARELVCRVPDAGAYSILIYDQQQTHIGKYTLTIAKK